jgi:hypothetical protein
MIDLAETIGKDGMRHYLPKNPKLKSYNWFVDAGRVYGTSLCQVHTWSQESQDVTDSKVSVKKLPLCAKCDLRSSSSGYRKP